MPRITLAFGEFGWHGLHEAADGLDLSPQALVAEACVHYLDQLDADPGRRALRLPRREAGPQAHTLEVVLPSPLAESMGAAGEAAGADLVRLTHHAVFVFVSDLATGRAAVPGRRGPEADEGDEVSDPGR